MLFRSHWRKAWLVMLATMLVDVDHLLADPIYDPNRCSIGFHPLHTAPAIASYVALSVPPTTRVIGLGLVIHMGLDATDCWVQRQSGGEAGGAALPLRSMSLLRSAADAVHARIYDSCGGH